MQIFLVGGFIRDTLLQKTHPRIQPGDKDWVVVGATPAEMLSLGYRPVGASFPVFLHPTTQEEYALARTERKNGLGYHGFTFYCSPNTTLIEDLSRRDLTINAIAMDTQGHYIDPFHGIQDLEQKVLRHIGPAFEEDPVRLLRIARFQARFPDFTIAEETLALMKKMSTMPDIQTLTPERVHKELEKALQTNTPEYFFMTLEKVHLLQALFGPMIWNTTTQTFLQTVSQYTNNPATRLVALSCHFSDIRSIDKWREKLRISKWEKRLCVLFVQSKEMLRKNGLSEETLLRILERIDAVRKPERALIILQLLRLFYSIQLYPKEIISLWNHVDTTRIAQAYRNTPKRIAQEILQARHQQTKACIQRIVSRETLTIIS